MLRGVKGQFYLIAAIILATIIVTLVSITNYSVKKDSSHVENIGKGLETEIEKVIDYDEINGQNKLDNFTAEYSSFAKDMEIFFIETDGSSTEAYTYIEEVQVDLSSDVNILSDEITFVQDDIEYTFDLNKGKNFYFVITQDIGGEKYVYTN